ncbi:hypothetical protein GCM10025858_36790 [Alicyclobacillus sacchari]|nr:hypothetical protein GCM10025858_00710 [Alicyclobacillus sacchari]GMA59176.1 hypothetical protein GCM10025858_36790 [Alicyclobacillus sacchari]
MADNSLGSVRISNMALASVLKQRGIEPLVHVTCRDRNLIGQQSHLMGLHVLGVRNILLITAIRRATAICPAQPASTTFHRWI